MSLGHYLLHNGCHTDSFEQAQPNRIEREANRFAGELLMPERLLRKSITELKALDLSSIDTTKELAWIFKTSPQAMEVQLNRLNLRVYPWNNLFILSSSSFLENTVATSPFFNTKSPRGMCAFPALLIREMIAPFGIINSFNDLL